MHKRGQFTIFAIVAVIIVALIIVAFLLFSRTENPFGSEFTPESYMDTCLRDELSETINLQMEQGGIVAPQDFKTYSGSKVAYVCKNINYYQPCITQYPLYLSQVEEQLETELTKEAARCFEDFEMLLEANGYTYSGDEPEETMVNATLKPGFVELTVEHPFSYEKNDRAASFDSLSISQRTELHRLASVANVIAAQEAKFCYFEYVGYMILNPELDIRKFAFSDSTKVYTIIHDDTKEIYNIAVRGCAIEAL